MILLIENAGLRVVLHAHDEVVVEVESSCVEEALNEVTATMSAPDPRCPGLPLACEAFVSDRYLKDAARGGQKEMAESQRA